MKTVVYIINCYGNYQEGDNNYRKYLDGCIEEILNSVKKYDVKHVCIAGGYTKNLDLSEAGSVSKYITRMLRGNEIETKIHLIEAGKNASGNIYFSLKQTSDNADFFVFSDKIHFNKNHVIASWINMIYFRFRKKIKNIGVGRKDNHPLHKKLLQNIQLIFYVLFGFLFVPFDIYGADIKQIVRSIVFKDVVTKLFAFVMARILI